MLRKQDKKTIKRVANLPFRLNGLFFAVALLFLILLFRLAQMQLINADFYQKKLTASTTYTVKSPNQRGKIYDATGTLLVNNVERNVLTFTRSNMMTTHYIKELAQELPNYVTLTDSKVSTRDKKDYYLADSETYKKVVDALPDDKKYDFFGNSLTESTIYKNAVDSVTDAEIDYPEDELKVIHAFIEMSAAQTFATVNITTDALSDEQMAAIEAHQKDLEGLAISKTWDRDVADTTLASLVGSISSEKTGLPEEDAKDYLKKGYSLNDRVGTSYLEKAYESDLQGEHTVRTVTVNRKNTVVSDDITKQGSAGDSLKLTIDLNFENQVQSILEQYYNADIANGQAVYSDGIYAVAIEPSTGKVLALAGLKHDVGSPTASRDILGTINNVFTPGSVVKGATLSAGWQNNVLSGNEVLNDQEILGIKSWFTSGVLPINAVQALEYSSNTYMLQIALRLMGENYEPGKSLSGEDYKEAMDKLRATFAEYGLGTTTGLDLPEAIGYIPSQFNFSDTLFESFGQYDSYSPMQLAQYIATIANDGKRVSTHVVEGIYQQTDGNLGEKLKDVSGQLLNTVSLPEGDMALIQEGFYDVVNSNSLYATGSQMRSSVTTISGKTGTAETYTKDSGGNTVKTVNLNALAYNEDRSIAVAVLYPHAATTSTYIHQQIARDIINQYVSNQNNQD
ncbi:penicillin-binding transpeptidase domain-containing protein [Streptococcus sp. zg-JUN1979]|uniref:penicillin-binding transpeptidase domain-containing protein n=1 Tax=Streptococcus sp. zg-JUN1979 TaxID=3391450 RepID=UPI0039A6157E